ncbi:conserved hypothetical protein [Tenacibaculum sp. 190524A02b]|uniref:Uncharacterized protein n=1 Tax=Tenacibaculum vairaonense TaxID=3137860 RepID=A0ABP1FAV1_9FLAO
MSLSGNNKKIIKEERRIGRHAAEIVEDYVRHKIARHLNIWDQGGVDELGRPVLPILEATKVKAKTGEHRLLGLNLTSNHYGFIHHHGVQTQRDKHIVLLQNYTSFIRHTHPFKQKATGIFDNIYEESGALKILANGLVKTRGDAVKAQIKGVVVQLNKQDHG